MNKVRHSDKSLACKARKGRPPALARPIFPVAEIQTI